MANKTRVRVELKNKYHDPHKNFKDMFQEFKKQVSNAGILHEYKSHQEFVSPAQKRRKKRREAIKKQRQEQLAEKILSGERVKAPSGVVKKILTNHKKKQRKRGSYVKE
jgi:ribosomal protein S21